MENLSRSACHGGRMEFWSHRSASTDTDMRFGIFLPPQAAHGRCPTLMCLAGLTSTHENFPQNPPHSITRPGTA